MLDVSNLYLICLASLILLSVILSNTFSIVFRHSLNTLVLVSNQTVLHIYILTFDPAYKIGWMVWARDYSCTVLLLRNVC